MDQEIQFFWSPELLQEEQDLLFQLQDQYFFDTNFMVVPDIKIPFFKFEVLSSKEYDIQRKRLLFTMLKYDIGLEILIKLIHRRDQSPLNGHYFLKTLDEMAYIIFNMQNELLEILNKTNQGHPEISKRIVLLFKSLLSRKKKECARLNITADLQAFQHQFEKIKDIDSYITYFPYFREHEQEIEQVLQNEQNQILRQIIIFDNERQFFDQLMSLTIFQQELLMIYLNNKNVRELYLGIYLAIYYTDEQQPLEVIVQNMMPYYFEIENWKLLVIFQLMQQHQEQDAYELLLASKVEWNDLANADIIIQLLVASQRALQAYVYVTELRKENALKFFINEMIIQKQIPNLLLIDFTPDQDKIVNDIIKNNEDQFLLIEFVKKLLRTRKYFQAIEFYSKVRQSELHTGIDRIEDLIKRSISQLPEIEEQYYLAKINNHQLTEEQQLIETILENQDANKVRSSNSVKYFVDHSNLTCSKDCFGWKRDSLIGAQF